LQKSEVLIVGNAQKEFKDINFANYPEKSFIDLTGLKKDVSKDNYIGIAW